MRASSISSLAWLTCGYVATTSDLVSEAIELVPSACTTQSMQMAQVQMAQERYPAGTGYVTEVDRSGPLVDRSRPGPEVDRSGPRSTSRPGLLRSLAVP